MVDNIRRIFGLWGVYAKMDLVWFLRDTKYCIYNIIADVISNLAAIAGVFLLAERFGGIGGMNKTQVLFMLGYASTIDGVRMMFFSMNNVSHISRIIGRGQLDHRLIQPVPLWMQLLTEGFIPVSGNSLLVCGLGIVIYATAQLGISVGLFWLLLFAVSVFLSVGIVLSSSYIASCIAFYAPVAGEEISTTIVGLFTTLQGFPLGGLSLSTRLVLCSVVPVGLTAWFPASMLMGMTPKSLPDTLLVIVTIVLTLTATTLFRKGLKHYAKNGSIRYSDRGHRR